LVWNHADLSGGPLVVLLAMADVVDDWGGTFFQKKETLAEKCRIDVRTISRILRKLESDGLIECTQMADGRRGHYDAYTINLANLVRNSRHASAFGGRDQSENKTTGQNVHHDLSTGHSVPNHRTFSAEPPDILHRPIETRPLPILESSYAASGGAAPDGAAARVVDLWKKIEVAVGDKFLSRLAYGEPSIAGDRFQVAFDSGFKATMAERDCGRCIEGIVAPLQLSFCVSPAMMRKTA
jgi:hypothetical protein